LNKAAGEAERRRRARARKEQLAPPTDTARSFPYWLSSTLDDCPDRDNHDVCPRGGEHDWYKPHPRPADHKYQCLQCGHYDLDDYK
jgi:hypothetical protein